MIHLKTDGEQIIIDGNVIGNVYQPQLYGDYFSTTVNANFADDVMPAGVDTEGKTFMPWERNSVRIFFIFITVNVYL